jgi:phosphoribosylanthranilate isomerase
MKLKICGMKYPENILEVAALLPDYMGFIFWERSSRYFEVKFEIPKSIKKQAFCQQSRLRYHRKILEIIYKQYNYGKESADFCLNLKE